MVFSPPHHPSSSEDVRLLLSYHTLPAHEGRPGSGIWSVLLDGVRRKEPSPAIPHAGFLTGSQEPWGTGRAAQAFRVRIPQGLSYSVASAEDRGLSPRHQNKSSNFGLVPQFPGSSPFILPLGRELVWSRMLKESSS